MNSKQPNFDWHAYGVWVMHSPMDEPLVELTAVTPYSCRAETVRTINKPWSKLVEEGYYVQGYAAIQPPELRVQEQVTASESHWRYPATGKAEDQPPKGVGLLLLTEGKISVTGDWTDTGGFIAWAPKIRRDKALEEALGIL